MTTLDKIVLSYYEQLAPTLAKTKRDADFVIIHPGSLNTLDAKEVGSAIKTYVDRMAMVVIFRRWKLSGMKQPIDLALYREVNGRLLVVANRHITPEALDKVLPTIELDVSWFVDNWRSDQQVVDFMLNR